MKIISSILLNRPRLLFPLLGLGILITSFGQNIAIANDDIAARKSQVTFEPPTEERPQKTTGGASRSISQCINYEDNASGTFAAVLPVSNQGLTASAYPTILAYIPKTSANNVFLSWRSENDDYHFQKVVKLENKGGIVSFRLPKDSSPLAIDENYEWSLGIMCGGKLKPDSPLIQGQIKRIELPGIVTGSLDDFASVNNAALYAEPGLWYETIAIMAELTMSEPDNLDLGSNWEKLLNAAGLENMAKAELKISQPDP